MAEGVSPKLKILLLLKIFREKTDENHSITMQDILSELKKEGIVAERKSIYYDIECLEQYGIEIVKEQKDRTFYYRMASREFELPELKLLVDSVQSARFITEKKSNELIRKIEALASDFEASELQSQVFVTERIKSGNEKILYNIDAVHKAIDEDSKICFQYFNWDMEKKKVLKRDGKIYKESPWALTIADENYYLVCYDDEQQRIKYFRVDKMMKIELTGEAREGKKEFRSFDIAAYARKRFHMFDGEERTVTLTCHQKYAGTIIDYFGKDVPFYPVDEKHFEAVVDVAVSKQFFGWVLAISDGVELTGPDDVVEEMREFVKKISKQYKKKK